MQDFFQSSATPDPFKAKLAFARNLLDGLRDPEGDFSGSGLLRLLNEAYVDCIEACDNQKSLACYIPFDRVNKPSFINLISCRLTGMDDKKTERTQEQISGSLFHEISHAVSWHLSPELHASPFNANTPIILCPDDYAMMVSLTERVAYANAGWLLSLALKDNPAMGHVVTPVNGPMFEFLRAREGTLQGALTAAGELSMRTSWATDIRDGHPLTMEQYYQWLALSEYDRIMKARIKDGDIPLVVRLEPHNILSIAQSFGPNIAARGQNIPPMRPLDQAWLGRIRGMLYEAACVPQYEYLPTFDNALASFGHTPSSFMEMSKNTGAAPAPRAAKIIDTHPVPVLGALVHA